MPELSINVDENTTGKLASGISLCYLITRFCPGYYGKRPEEKDRQRDRIYGKKETADRRPFGLLVSSSG